MKPKTHLSAIALLTVLAVFAAACGGDGQSTPADDPAALPTRH